MFSKGAARFASAGTDSVVRVFAVPDPDSADQEPFVQLLHGHTGPVMTMEFSPSGDRLLTGALDGMARIWSYKRHEKAWDSIICRVGNWIILNSTSYHDSSENADRGVQIAE